MLREIYGKKLGMTQIFLPEGDVVGVTLVEVEPVCVLEKVDYPTKSVAKAGIFAVKEKRQDKVNWPIRGYFRKKGVPAYKMIRELSIEKGADFSFLNKKEDYSESKNEKEPAPASSEASASEQAQSQQTALGKRNPREVGIEIFNEGEIVDVRAKSKGRGFAGGMKRHGWSGQPKSHGSMSHRRIGSAGSNTYPGRVLRGLRMPGHMGDKYYTVKKVKIVRIDKEKQLLFIRGSVPGARGSVVRIKKTSAK